MTDTANGETSDAGRVDGETTAERRIAVVFIHGQGQQQPMEDVQELARTVWDADPNRRGTEGACTWTVPDARLGMADLGRVTTEAGKHGVRVDFFELYWAHFMTGNRLGHFLSWFGALQARPRREAPAGLLPVRQWVIRLIESVTLLCVLLSFAVALLMPPVEDGLTSADFGRAFLGLTWFPSSADLSIVLLALAAISIAGAWFSILINEIIGGASERSVRRGSLLGIKARATLSVIQVWPLIGLSVMALVVLVHLFIWQGPYLQWADARLGLLIGVIVASLLLAFRRSLSSAAAIAMGTAVLAIACALFAGLSTRNLWFFGNHVGAVGDWILDGFGHAKGQEDTELQIAFYTIFVFAGAWFTLGLNAAVSAARRWYTRLFWTAVTCATSMAIAAWMVVYLYPGEELMWAVYAASITLVSVIAFGGILLQLAANAFLVPVMTDSARYFSRDPEHVDARQKIREAGVSLLDKLHDPRANYERVIVVAHSLGSAVGYELLMDYWARQSGSYVFQPGDSVGVEMAAVENAARALHSATDAPMAEELRQRFRTAQRRLSRALKSMEIAEATHGHHSGKGWLITDFVTLGSPLTHASLLLADGRRSLRTKQATRTLATCPPMLFDSKGKVDPAGGTMSFVGWDGRWRPMHSAVFAPVRWTNHYFATGAWIVLGDPIGGPIAPAAAGPKHKSQTDECSDLGAGVIDVRVDRNGTGKLFAHNEYWKSDLSTEALADCLARTQSEPKHIAALIAALDLSETRDA